jgi:tetratricopeptide (TPR) repeat protein
VQNTSRKFAFFLFLGALLLRLLYLFQMAGSPYFDAPFLDELYHVQWAREIAFDQFWGQQVFFRAPLYSYLLAVIFLISGANLFIALLLQHALGACAVVLMYRVAAKLVPPRVAQLAGILAALYAPFFYFEGQFLDTSLAIFIYTATVLALLHYLEAPTRRTLFIFGLLNGIAAITRPNILAFTILCMPLMVLFHRRPPFALPRRESLLRLALFIAAVALPIAPITVRNAVVGHCFVPISSYAGINFYIGNNPNADGFTARTARRYASFGKYRDSVELFAEEEAAARTGHRLNAAEVQSYWTRQTLAWIAQNPAAELRLLFKKTVLFFNSVEIKNNKNIYFVAQYSWLLKFLLWVLPFGVVFPLACAGFSHVWRSADDWQARMKLVAALLFLACMAGSVILFFVSDRYRLPFVPLLLPFAAAGLLALPQFLRRPQWHLAVPWLACIAIAVVCNIDWYHVRIGDLSRDYWSVANCYAEKNALPEAEAAYLQALALNPNDTEILNNLGETYYRRQAFDQALEAFISALRLDPNYLQALNNLGVVQESLRHYPEAEQVYRQVVAREPRHLLARSNLGDVLLKQSRPAEALQAYQDALARNPSYLNALVGAARACRALGRTAEAAAFTERAVKLGGEAVRKAIDAPAGS